jgi:hypothetical protein
MRGVGEIILLTQIVTAIRDAWFGVGWATTDPAIIVAITAIQTPAGTDASQKPSAR